MLHVDDEPLSAKRLRYEPDFHREPTWRREGSRPVNVVPIKSADASPTRPPGQPWWEQPDVAELEREWRATGTVAGLRIPADYRSFVLKTVAALRHGEVAVTIEAVAGSLARWLSPAQVDEIRHALLRENVRE